MRFHIYDGRTKFWQWDLEQKLIVSDPECKEVHFCNKTDDCSLVCEVYEKDGQRLVNVPNILLQSARPITAFLFVKTEEGAYTQQSQIFFVLERTKPADYVYTETEVWTAEKAVADALKEAKESGDFKGEKGDKGDAGAIDFIVVNELPAIGDSSKIYLLPETDGEEPNRFGEYVFVEGAWERIGSAGVEVNLDEYVKNTDYATKDEVGVVKVNSRYGIYAMADGTLYTMPASQDVINQKKSTYNPIVPQTLDYAVKKALADCKLADTDYAWTEEEKTAARELLGAVGNTDYANSVTAGLVRVMGEYGVQLVSPSTGTIGIRQATEAEIDAKTSAYRSISPKNLDYAVKAGMTTNAIKLTDEEKATACSWLGVSDLIAELTARVEELEAMLKQ